ncbi:MAG: hypothetical protein RBT40_04685 [Petrimonas sp.]|jgi:hypothetical protein|nr:hypothetical protein [Petrimonas sp.]
MNSVHPLNPYKINPFAGIAQLVEHNLAPKGEDNPNLGKEPVKSCRSAFNKE